MNSGSLDSLNVSLRCGCRAKARQMRLTVLWLTPHCLRHGPRAPVRRVARGAFPTSRHHALHGRIGDRARRPGPRFIEQPVEPLRDEAAPPLPHGLLGHMQLSRDRRVRLSRRASQDQAGAQGQSLAPSSDAGPSPPTSRVLPRSASTPESGDRPDAWAFSFLLGERVRSLLCSTNFGLRTLGDAGIDLTRADLFVGSSVGAVLGCQIQSGQSVGDLYAAELTSSLDTRSVTCWSAGASLIRRRSPVFQDVSDCGVAPRDDTPFASNSACALATPTRFLRNYRLSSRGNAWQCTAGRAGWSRLPPLTYRMGR